MAKFIEKIVAKIRINRRRANAEPAHGCQRSVTFAMRKLTMNKTKREHHKLGEQAHSFNKKEPQDELPKSIHSKSKKSLFPKLTKRRKHIPPAHEKYSNPEVVTLTGIKFQGPSSTSSQEFKTSEFNYTDVSGDQNTDSNPYKMIRDLIKGSSTGTSDSEEGLLLDQCTLINHSEVNPTASTLFITAFVPKPDSQIIDGLHELQDTFEQLQGTEKLIIGLIKSYVRDESLKEEILQTSFNYFSLQFEAKSQTACLSNKLWLQQIDVGKSQEANLKKRLDFLVKQNRTLRAELDALCRQCEKFSEKNILYPKRFLQMRSFGKTYAKHLVNNNKRLYGRVRSMTEIIYRLEREVDRLQIAMQVLVKEKQELKSQVYSIETSLRHNKSEYDVEKTVYVYQVKNQGKIIDDSERYGQSLLKELCLYEQHLKGLSIAVNLQKYCVKEKNRLPELINQIRGCVSEILTELLGAYGNATLMIKDIHKLRDTNARLQENLQKSTSELDNLSKKIQSNSSLNNSRECMLEQENAELKEKLENLTKQLSQQERAMDNKVTELKESYKTINLISAEKSTMRTQIDEVSKLFGESTYDNLSKKLQTSNDKIEHLRNQLIQKNSEQMELVSRCHTLEKENQNLMQNEEVYRQEVAALNESLTMLASENEIIKKQLSSEHQTVLSLQNERVKYLEEKNVLKTIFQHLKSELARVQQLEGTIADMTKETSRLTLIAEFNKQLGEQLKSEVEMKDNAISELKQGIEKLSNMQMDNDKEKFSLFLQLSELTTIKDKLSESLQVELKKYMQLDETKKQLENDTRSQLKFFEEMQKSERNALKEMLLDFKSLTKQRNALLKMQEESKQKNRDLEAMVIHLRQELELAHEHLNEKCEEYKTLVNKLQEQEALIKSWEEKTECHSTKYDKAIRKFEKLVIQMRKEKDELENSNEYLKTTIQKMHSELNETRTLEMDVANKLTVKTAEADTLLTEFNKCKTELQSVSQENGRLKTELDYINKLYEKQSNDLQTMLNQFSSKDNMYLESKTAEMCKETEINKLNKVIVEQQGNINQLMKDCDVLRQQNEQQNRILIGYEDQLVLMPDLQKERVELEGALHNLQVEHASVKKLLEKSQKDYDKLKAHVEKGMLETEKEKEFYKTQAVEIFAEYSDQKQNIELEIGTISQQLNEVNDNLMSEKQRFEELSEAHDELKRKFIHLKESLANEVAAHKETCRKMADLNDIVKTAESERDKYQEDVHELMTTLNEDKAKIKQLTKENDEYRSILEHGRQQYTMVKQKCHELEHKLDENKAEMEVVKLHGMGENAYVSETEDKFTAVMEEAEEKITTLQAELDECQKTLSEVKEEYFILQQQVTGLEFKNCELTLQLHETERKLETERSLYQQLKDEYDQHFTKILKLEETGNPLTSSTDTTFF